MARIIGQTSSGCRCPAIKSDAKPFKSHRVAFKSDLNPIMSLMKASKSFINVIMCLLNAPKSVIIAIMTLLEERHHRKRYGICRPDGAVNSNRIVQLQRFRS